MNNPNYLAPVFAAASVYILWHYGGRALERFLTRRYTVAYDVPHVANEREESKRIRGTAVICGGR